LPLVFEWDHWLTPRFGSDFSGGGRISRASPRVLISQEPAGRTTPPCHPNAISLIQIDLFSDAGKRGLVLNPLQFWGSR
jgi:hypothetical protein